MTNYNDGKWHGWDGGECPVHPKSMVEICTIGEGVFDEMRHGSGWQWEHEYEDDNIIAFRVVKEYREPRDRWAYLTHMFDTEAEAKAFRAQVDAVYPGRGHLDTPITHWREVV